MGKYAQGGRIPAPVSGDSVPVMLDNSFVTPAKVTRKQWKVEGQLGDRALVESGKGSVFINAGGSETGDNATAMMSPAAARELADRLRDAADQTEANG